MADDPKDAITAVIPAFNEEKTIGRIVTETRRFVRDVIVVDDGSSDQTANVAAGAGAIVLKHGQNSGYGSALSTGFRFVRSNGTGIMIVLDGDGQHNPAEIPKLIAPIMSGEADVVTGSRFMNGQSKGDVPAYRKLGIGIVNRAWGVANGEKMTDTQCGFRAYSRAAIDSMDIKESNMSASLEILDEATRKNLKVVEVPVSVGYDGDTSTVSPGRHGMELVNYVIRKLKDEHPLLIFGGGGVILSVLGLGFGVIAINSYFDSRYLPFGYTMIAAVLIYVGTLMVFGGLILNSIQNLAGKLESRNSK